MVSGRIASGILARGVMDKKTAIDNQWRFMKVYF
jgi:hypothetical protein